ncbi:MAG TPA: hypothetical protein VM573_03795 [Actinomycetota bacterium]|jgi:hypothetical protein|nr:hypothetical protein [Actinomycetota bacterium]
MRAAATAGALVVPLVAVPVAAPADPACAQAEETMEVSARARRKVYSVGETAVIDVSVTDRLTGRAEEDVDAGAVIRGKKKTPLMAFGETDSDGTAVLRIPLKPDEVRPGWQRVQLSAWDSIRTPVLCTARSGGRIYEKLFRVAR